MIRSALIVAFVAALSIPAWPPTPRAKVESVAGEPMLSHWKDETHRENEKFDFQTTGEVARGKTFQQDIGHGLMFMLTPPSNAPDAGWVIEIVPKTPPASGPVEFSAIATPPYHAYNDRVVATAYGRSARDVVSLKDRTFFFVESVSDERRAEEVVNAAYYPTDLSDQDRVRVAEEQHEIQISKGQLRILKSHTSSSKTIGGPGVIDWIRFEVGIEFSPGLNMSNILGRVIRPQ